jgi:signal transduction histidine kinase
MDAVSAFFTRNIVYVYFFYGLAFFALGLVVLLESGRTSEFRFARALIPLALFGFVHGAHEWFEMFQIFAAHEAGHTTGLAEELFRVGSLAVSFLLLLAFGMRLLPGAEDHPRASIWQVAAFAAIWLGAVFFVYLRQRPTADELVVAADVLSRYILGITGALLACWALLRERRDFHARGMSAYGQALLWAALAFFVYGVIGQLFVRPSIVAPSQVINTALFVRLVGFPVQLLRGLAAAAIAFTLGSALRAFEAEGRLRLARANKARIEAQAATLEAQTRRTVEVEALNVQLRATTSELSALVEMSRTLSSTIELDRVLHYALYQIVNSFEEACYSAIFLKQAGGALELAQEYHSANASPSAGPSLLQAVARRTVDSGQAVGVGYDGQIAVLDFDPEGITQPKDPWAVYQVLGVPLVAQGEIVGGLVMSVLSDGQPFRIQDLNLLAAFSRQVTAFIENARLYKVVQEREVRLAELVRQLVNVQEGERQRIARELHDETGQKLTALAMGLAAVEASLGGGDTTGAMQLVHDLRELSNQAISELRNIMSDLRPSLLDDLGLAPALRSYVQQYAARYPEMHVTLSADRPSQRLLPEHETVLFRVAQEALTNVARHAHATEVRVLLTHLPGLARLEISDNGIGFDPLAPSRLVPGSGLGLVGMQERVTLVGGTCRLESAPGQGTRVVVELPVK